MKPPTIFDTCTPRADVRQGAIAEADFAADLAAVVGRRAGAEYLEPQRFFADTYPTRGLRDLLANVCRRLAGTGDEAAAIFRLDTSYGGGKTHALIALTHAARGARDVPGIAEFVDPALLPAGEVRVAAFDGENADPANGRDLGDGVRAHTPWGEIAYALAGPEGYARVRASDERGIAPGAETLRALFGGRPTLILLDELSVYLRKVYRAEAGDRAEAGNQLTAFLTSLFKAVEGAPAAALVYTLAVGKGGRATDAYRKENEFIADRMAEAESVSARKATLLNPTEEDETIEVLRRRLFERIDDAGRAAAVDAYRALWNTHRDTLSREAARPGTVEAFRASYPLHPEVLDTLTAKTATLDNFQRVRGMLRLLAKTVAHLWRERPADATAIHLHHVDPGHEPIRQEIVTRLEQKAYVPAIDNDIAGRADKPGLAQQIDREHHAGLPPFATWVARTIFLHTLAFNEPLKGLSADRLRYAIASPAADLSFLDEARRKFIAESAYLDDRPAAPLRFLAEANLRQMIRNEERHVDREHARAELRDRIREIFSGRQAPFEAILFPAGAFDVADETGDGRPKLIVLSYDAVLVGENVDDAPELVRRIHERKGAEGAQLRAFRNNVVFVAAGERGRDEMERLAIRRLALRELRKPERLQDLAEHQQADIREQEARSETDLAIAIQQCYRHVFYPSRNRVGAGAVDVAHTAIEQQSAADKPGAGQQQVVRVLRALSELQNADDAPCSPRFVRDRTPLRKGQMSTRALRDEFRRDPGLPILLGDAPFVRCIRAGVDGGEYVYQRDDLLYGPGDPAASIAIDENAVVSTMAYARNKNLWPRGAKESDEGYGGESGGTGGGSNGGGESGETGGASGGGETGETGAGTTPPPGAATFSAEGVLREALVRLWEKARAARVERLAAVTIRTFEAGDGFRLLGPVGSVPAADKRVVMAGGYETADGSTFECEFEGSVQDAGPVKEFLEPQLRAAASRDLKIDFRLTFPDGLPLRGDACDRLTERLTRFAGGAAYVEAAAEGRQG